MARNDTIALKLVADNNDLRKKLAASEKSLKGYERRVQRMGKGTGAAFKGTAGSLAATGGAAVAASKAFDFLKDSVKTTTDLTLASAKLSKITGSDIATSAQWVQMTKARGIGTKQLQTGFVSLSKQISQAQKGTGKAAQAFDKLGVSQDALRRGDTNAVLLQISDGLAKVKSPAERAALAQQMLGRSGKDLLGVLSGGSGALKEQLGIYKGSSQEIEKNAGSVTSLRDNQRRLSAATVSLKVAFGTILIPVLTRLSGVMVKLSNLSPGLKRALMVLVGVVAVAFAVKKVTLAFQALRLAMLANPFMLVATIAITAGLLIWRNWSRIKGWLVGAWNKIKDAFRSVARTVVAWARKGFLGPVGWIIANWRRVLDFFRGLVGKIGGTAARIGRALWGGVKRGANSVVGFVKGIFNSVMSTIESGINGIIFGINKAIDLFNKLPGKDIGKIGKVRLPRLLADGGIITKPTFALVGEAGPEAVVPLSRNKRARGRAVAAAAGIGGGGNNYFTINTTGSVDEQALAAKIGWQLATRGLA